MNMRWVIFPLLALLLFGCARPVPIASYKRPEMDLSLVRRLAVLPFDNLTREQFANEKVRRTFISELLATEAFEVVDPGEVARALADMGLQPGMALKVEEIKRLGKALNVQAVVMGSVTEYGEMRSGAVTAPIISFEARMVDTDRGGIVWSVSISEGGIGFGARLLGSTSDTISDLTAKATRKALDTLFR